MSTSAKFRSRLAAITYGGGVTVTTDGTVAVNAGKTR